MKQENFLYFGRRPTNVCYNGTSFPVLPGDVVRCYREFWEAFIPDERLYKVIADDDPRKPKYKFGRSPVFVKADPTGGLPVTSDASPGANPRLREKMKLRRDPALVMGNEAEVNPYDLGIDKGLTVDISTSPDLPSVPDPEKLDFTTALGVSDITEGDEDPVVDETESEGDEFEVALFSRSGLRKLTRDAVLEECKRLAEAGCPHNTEKLDAFLGYDDDTTRGEMFPQLWDYCGYND